MQLLELTIDLAELLPAIRKVIWDQWNIVRHGSECWLDFTADDGEHYDIHVWQPDDDDSDPPAWRWALYPLSDPGESGIRSTLLGTVLLSGDIRLTH